MLFNWHIRWVFSIYCFWLNTRDSSEIGSVQSSDKYENYVVSGPRDGDHLHLLNPAE
jgi:hypothetical protein